MSPHAKNLVKEIDLTGISQFVLEEHEWLDRLPHDGRANRIDRRSGQAGGLCYYASLGVRHIDAQAQLGLFSLVGESEAGEAHDAVDHLRLARPTLLGVAKKKTNRSRVTMTPEGERQIVRLERGISFAGDLDRAGYCKLQSDLGRSRAAVLGNLPVELAQELIEQGKRLRTYISLCPGREQFAALTKLRPHALMVNANEASEITGDRSDDRDRVFHSLLKQVRATHLVVMTAGGGPVHVAERATDRTWKLSPCQASATNARGPFPLGNGDVLAGVASYFLGQPRRLLRGELVREAVAIAQAVATYHYAPDAEVRTDLRLRCEKLLPQFRSGVYAKAAERAA